MNRRTWFRTLTGAFATLATGLGFRKVEKRWIPNPDYATANHRIIWAFDANSYARYDGQHWHFEDVKPEEEI